MTPLVFLPVLEILTAAGACDERLMRLLIMVEVATPSAQMVIVSLNEGGALATASKLAYMFSFQYVGSILTLTFWITIAMKIIY